MEVSEVRMMVRPKSRIVRKIVWTKQALNHNVSKLAMPSLEKDVSRLKSVS